MKSRIAIAAGALLSLCGPAALAQGWDDVQPAPAQEQAQQAEAARRMQQANQRQDQRSALQRAIERTGPGYANTPPDEPTEKKWRVVPDANGQPMVIEDTRGPAPVFQGGFGKVDPNNPDAANQLSPLTPAMLRIPGSAGANNGQGMWEQTADPGFFGGLKPPTEPIKIDQEALKVQTPSTGPAWAKDRIEQKHHYVNGQEHFGAEDPHGFF